MAIKYKWLAERLREMAKRMHKEGLDKLPSEAELCKRYRVSRQTVRQALLLLEQEDIIEKRQGSGSFLTGRGFAGSDNNYVALMITSSTEYIYPNLLSDLQGTLWSQGYNVKLFLTDNRIDLERQYLEEFLLPEKAPLALLVEGVKSGLPNPNLDLYHHLKQQKVPILFLHNYYLDLEDTPYVMNDNYQGAATLVDYLYRKGHTQIAGIFPSDDLQGLERYQGFIESMNAKKLSINDDYIGWFHRSNLLKIEKARDTEFLRAMVDHVIDSTDILCSAIVCYNDEIAFFLADELQSRGYKIPEDFAIVSFDNSYLVEAGKLGITSLGHDPHALGRQAALSIVDLIKGKPVASKRIPFQLYERESSNK